MRKTIELSDFRKVGVGVERPETVLVDSAGCVYCSDKKSGIAEVLPDGGLRRMGRAGGDPNGIAMDSSGRFLIANHGFGLLQRLEPETGEIETLLADVVDGYPIKWINYVLVDRSGTMWVSVSTATDDPIETVVGGVSDGFIVRLNADGSGAEVVAGRIATPNCMALDEQGKYLYVVRTVPADIVRFEIKFNQLGPEEQFSPQLGRYPSAPSGVGLDGGQSLDKSDSRMLDLAAAAGTPFADGCAFDGDGNLWVTLLLTNNIVAVTPSREVIPIILGTDHDREIMVGPTSIAWGGADGRDVYIGSLVNSYLVQGRSSVPGMPMIHQQSSGAGDG